MFGVGSISSTNWRSSRVHENEIPAAVWKEMMIYEVGRKTEDEREN